MPPNTMIPLRPDSPFAAEDNLSKRDKIFRRYAAAVERALTLFDSTLQVWADYISFLGRLSKALQTRPAGIDEVPHSRLVARRLAQCLSPSLPSGVHQKAIEVYALVFTILKKVGVSQELVLYLPGLCPLLSYASLTVKPALLSLYEDHLLVLKPEILHPATKALILGLLPGLEEESAEEFDRSLQLLRILGGHAEEEESTAGYNHALVARHFWQSLFLAVLTSPSRRVGGLAYIVRYLPKLGSYHRQIIGSPVTVGETAQSRGAMFDKDESVVISPEPGLLIRAFASGLRDENMLVQRGFLDLLTTHLPLKSEVLQLLATPEDVELLMSSAASIVIRKEMNLNRRLWAWFLGQVFMAEVVDSDPNSPRPNQHEFIRESGEVRQSYFQRWGCDSLVASLLKDFAARSLKPSARSKPFRVCQSLMDRWEIGSLVIHRVFEAAMENLRTYQSEASTSDDFSEVLKSGNVLFDGIQSQLIWKEIIILLTDAFSSLRSTTVENADLRIESTQQKLNLVWFIITTFNIQEDEMVTFHIPNALATILSNLCILINTLKSSPPQAVIEALDLSVKIAIVLLDHIPPNVLSTNESERDLGLIEDIETTDHENVMRKVSSIYIAFQESPGFDTSKAFTDLPMIISRDLMNIFLLSLDRDSMPSFLEILITLVSSYRSKTHPVQHDAQERLLASLERTVLCSTNEHGIRWSFTTTTLLELSRNLCHGDLWAKDHRVRLLIERSFQRLWSLIDISKPMHNVEATKCIWRLHNIAPDSRLIEALIATMMQSNQSSLRSGISEVSARRFAIFWTHSDMAARASSAVNVEPIGRKTGLLKRHDTFIVMPDLLSRPLLLMLESLESRGLPGHKAVVTWLQSLPNIFIVLEFLLSLLDKSSFLQQLVEQHEVVDNRAKDQFGPYQCQDETMYYFSLITDIILARPVNIEDALATQSKVRSSLASYASELHQTSDDSEQGQNVTVETYLVETCCNILQKSIGDNGDNQQERKFQQVCVKMLLALANYSGSRITNVARVEAQIQGFLLSCIEQSIVELQSPLIDLLIRIMQKKSSMSMTRYQGKIEIEYKPSASNEQSIGESIAKEDVFSGLLLDCLKSGLRSLSNQTVLEQFVKLLECAMTTKSDDIFSVALPLVNCISAAMEDIFQNLKGMFNSDYNEALPYHSHAEPLASLNLLFNSLEIVIARTHDKASQQTDRPASATQNEQPQGFFGSMVSGVFTSDSQVTKVEPDSDRSTLLLCFKDAVRVCLLFWSWGDGGKEMAAPDVNTVASFNFVSVRLRNRSRRALDHLFNAETLECLETLIGVWRRSTSEGKLILKLLQTLDSARPKNTIPAIFDSIYSRTNPAVLSPSRKSSLMSDLTEIELTSFLSCYIDSMDDDALDEVWTDCITFLKDVLGNPMPQRQILGILLRFVAILGGKVENTGYGEAKTMRREISDIFVRLLTTMFTISPMMFGQEVSEHTQSDSEVSEDEVEVMLTSSSFNVIASIASILPRMTKILIETGGILPAANVLSNQMILPTIRSKSFPRSINHSLIKILLTVARIPEASKNWKRDLSEAFNDPKFFLQKSRRTIRKGWMPLLRLLSISDRERMSELLSRIVSPTTAGLVFGVGASSARLDADRKCQLNLRRIALFILSNDVDSFTSIIGSLHEKLGEILAATAASSPSSVTRAEIYMVFRALMLRFSPIQLTPMWPTISAELHDALAAIGNIASRETYSITCILQAAKVLDMLLIINPDDFQMREWLYITDTADAIYRPSSWRPIALVDELSEALDQQSSSIGTTDHILHSVVSHGKRQPLLRLEATRKVARENLLDEVLRPFLRQLSIHTYEAAYRSDTLDEMACEEELLNDLFDESSLV